MAATAVSLRNEIAQELDTLPAAQLRKVREYVQLLRLRPLVGKLDPDQAWFWTDEWQQMERETEQDLAAGRVHEYASVDELRRKIESTG
jgi:hypothetical protein